MVLHLGVKQTLGQLDLTDGQSTELLTLGGKQGSESCSQEPTRLPGNMAYLALPSLTSPRTGQKTLWGIFDQERHLLFVKGMVTGS